MKFDHEQASHHISEKSFNYQENRLDARSLRFISDDVFGSEALGYFYAIEGMKTEREMLHGVEKDTADKNILLFEKNLKEELQKTRKALLEKTLNNESKKAFELFLHEITADETTGQALREEFGMDNASREEVILATTKLLNDEIPDALFIQMLECHARIFEQRAQEFRHALPELQSRFLERMEHGIQEGYLPINKDDALQRIKETRVQLTDIVRTELGESLGDYSAELSRISVGSQVEAEDWFDVYAHELVHALSGRTILESSRENEGKHFQVIDHQRIGLRFKGRRKEEGQEINYSIYKWLNEAVTETIILYLSEKKDSISYAAERNLMLKVFPDQSSRDLLYKAYFENYDPDHPDRVPAWKALSRYLQKEHKSVLELLRNIGTNTT